MSELDRMKEFVKLLELAESYSPGIAEKLEPGCRVVYMCSEMITESSEADSAGILVVGYFDLNRHSQSASASGMMWSCQSVLAKDLQT